MTKSIGSVARNYISQNPTMKNEEILEKVKAEFPDAKTSLACIAWYKSKMKKEAKVQPVVVVRTVQMIEEEILNLQMELEELKEAEAKKLLDEEQELEEKLAKIKAMKQEMAEQE